MITRPVKTAEVGLPAPYEGWTAVVRTNITMAVYDQLIEGSWEEKLAALCETVQEWNFVDDDGNPVEVTPEAVQQCLGFDQITPLVGAIDAEIGRFLRELNTSG